MPNPFNSTPHTISQIDWKNFSYRDLVKATLTEKEAQEFARTLALLDYGPGPCPGKNGIPCGSPAQLTPKGDQFRCTHRRCDKNFSVRTGTYFEASNISYGQILDYLYLSMTHMTHMT